MSIRIILLIVSVSSHETGKRIIGISIYHLRYYMREYVKEIYNNRRGAISIVIEAAIMEFLRRNTIDDRSRSGSR